MSERFPLIDGKPIQWDERDQCFRFINYENKGPTQAEANLAQTIVFGWIMSDAPAQLTLGDARKLSDRIARGIAGRLKI